MGNELEELFLAAKSKIESQYVLDRHHIGAAVRVADGKIYAAVHLETYVGAVAICAEAVAIGMAIADGYQKIEAVAAVNQHGDPVSPCGKCRELIKDYSENATVVLGSEEGLESVAIDELLPHKYSRREG